jgi:hypothetical protein
MGFAGFTGWMGDAFVVAWAGGVGAAQGLAAAIDGVIPFWNPLEDLLYDGNDSTLQWSQALGTFARDVLLIAAVPNLTAWVKNPLMYELGATTIPGRFFSSLSHLSVIQRGESIYRQLGLRGFFLSRLATNADWTATVVHWSGLTPGGNLFIIGLFSGLDRWSDSE